MKAPAPHPFLAAEAGAATADADVLLLGLAADGGVSFRPGAVQAPSQIRAFSESIESYSPRAGRDLEDLRIIDLGDHDDRLTAEQVAGDILDVAWAGQQRPLLFSVGGDHSVTPPLVRAVASRTAKDTGGLAVVGFDAHLDFREDYEGDHACTYRRIEDHGVRCFVFGVRSGARSEWEDVAKMLALATDGLEMPSEVRSYLADRPVYVTLDIDVLDPSVAPGTGNPEAGGPSFGALLAAIEALEGLNVVACDLVEVSPPLDPSGITLGAASLLLREMMLRFTGSR